MTEAGDTAWVLSGLEPGWVQAGVALWSHFAGTEASDGPPRGLLSASRDVNTTIMELLIMVYACKTSCAKSVTGVIPYFPYSKQCKMRKRGSIVSKLLASMMCKAGREGRPARKP